jgi:TRAP-type uncharacterized transport system fused permease subunit
MTTSLSGGNLVPMETSIQAWKYAKGLYLIPAFMVFNPEIIVGGESRRPRKSTWTR